MAAGGAGGFGARGSAPRDPAVSRGHRAVRTSARLALLPPVLSLPDSLPSHGRRTQREHVPAILVLGFVDGDPVLEGGSAGLVAADGGVRRSRLPDPSRRAALAGG